MHKPKAIVFDLGRVLLEFDYTRAARNIACHCTLGEVELKAALDQSPLLFRYETGLMTTAEFFAEVQKLSTFSRDYQTFAPLFGDIFSEIPRMIELNRTLRKAGLPTYIFSNTNELAIEHIRERYPFFSEFTDYILSYEHRSMKPDSVIYGVVEQRTGMSGNDILYIDDRIENIEAGEKRGWQVIHHTDVDQTILRFRELELI
ncbi:MAG: HAD family hydrolase [Verrucomicrobiales bacterium]